ncbi:TerB N-terminal domain-containing protein [Olsenella sp. HMSC062G07]|uniref:TerB N-terminal domain-containing protein n=1 Tax=Olsenella sp. HMSC062G07 TaxID=1739330 RepID=UPI000A45E20D|nr:TerB N-terminal domain-containing protein [Olsenella sp. HMSC062G07]
MPRADELIQQLMANLRPAQAEVLRGPTYQDEPILRTGRQLLKASRERASWDATQDAGGTRAPRTRGGGAADACAAAPFGQRPRPSWLATPFAQASPPPSVELPDDLRRMRALARERGQDGRCHGGAALFYRQAALMAAYEDDLPFHGSFVSYYPTYEDLPDAVLRGYFTWRALFRTGELPRAPLTFVFIHAYELICGVGAAPGAATLHELGRLFEGYGQATEGAALVRYLPRWMRDYAVYHELSAADVRAALTPEALGSVTGEGRGLLSSVSVLARAQSALLAQERGGRPVGWDDVARAQGAVASDRALLSRNDLVRALDAASTYHILRSRAMRLHGDVLADVLPAVFARLVDHCRVRRRTNLVEGLFGAPVTHPYLMFSAAVFWEAARHPDARVSLPSGEVFACQDGRWTLRRPCEAHAPSRRLGAVLHAVDVALRERTGDLPAPKPRATPKFVQRIIEDEMDACLSRRAAARAARVTIDRGALGRIRASAGRTREALLTDEEREEGPSRPVAATAFAPSALGDEPRAAVASEAASGPAALGTASRPAAPEGGAVALSPTQRRIVGALLRQPPDDDALCELAREGVVMSLELDTINEAFLDVVGDTVVAFEDDTPRLVEDYVVEVRELLS